MKSFLRRIVPEPVTRILETVVEWWDMSSARVFSVNRVLASVYYFLLCRRFDREHLAVLKGRCAYYRSLRHMRSSSPLLRRNVHRLEKGLIMRPRRPVFAEAYIVETVRCFNRAAATSEFEIPELRWARDVLDEYFSVVEKTQVIGQALQEYDQGPGQRSCTEGILTAINGGRFAPYAHAALPMNSISFDELNRLFQRRRSVRWFNGQPVPRDLIYQCIDVSALAPSACNRQPFRFIVTTEQQTAARIAECAGGTEGFSQQLPALVVVIGDLSAYPKERDRHLIYIDSALASMQFMLAAETLGLSTCPINWPDIDRAEKRLHAILHLPGHERVIMLIAIGYGDPTGGIPYSQKKQGAAIREEFSLR